VDRSDVLIIGGGIMGVASALFLAEAGVRVAVFEAETVAAAASGRNAGSCQHPLDPVRAPLYASSLEVYRRIGVIGDAPCGLLVVSADRAGAQAACRVAAAFPELAAQRVGPDELGVMEPCLADDLHACLLRTGYPLRPAEATRRLAELAVASGARIEAGVRARPRVCGGGIVGVTAGGQEIAADHVVVAAGPWSRDLLAGVDGVPAIRALWGVTVEVSLPGRIGRRIEEWTAGQEEAPTGSGAVFELTPFEDHAILGATRTWERPDPERLAEAVIKRAQRFVPTLARVRPVEVRVCARPVSEDDRPVLGPVPGIEGLHVASGHGAYGISLGPASAALVVDELLGKGRIPDEFRAEREVG
jgi:glycine/D-amino acid oxidase-like deaminating enzyme